MFVHLVKTLYSFTLSHFYNVESFKLIKGFIAGQMSLQFLPPKKAFDEKMQTRREESSAGPNNSVTAKILLPSFKDEPIKLRSNSVPV